MSPSLEGIMFNRNANLSVRKPLLSDEPLGRFACAGPRERNGHAPPEPGPRRQLPGPQTPARDRFYLPPLPRDPYRKPSNIELGRRLPDSHNGYVPTEKVAYFQNKITAPSEFGLDRREAELVFRFDPHASDDFLGIPYSPAASVVFAKGPPPVPAARTAPKPRSPDDSGPFVFGVHGPGQFQIPSRTSEEDYDYADIDEEAAKIVIRDDGGNNGLNCCDKVNDWDVREKVKKRTLNRMFQIRDNRCKRKPTVQVVKGGKKDKIKCVLVGDGAVGKTSLITAYAQNKFRSEYEPTAHDTFNVMVEVDERPVCVEICDTAGQDSMSELRALCYPGTDVLMLCFSVVRPETFRSVGERWARAAAGVRAPAVLVGTQADLARDPRLLNQLRLRGEHPVSEAEARTLAASIGAEYVETSARTRTKLKEAFDSAILLALPTVVTKKPFWKKLFCIR